LEKERINIYHKRNTCFVGIDMHKDAHCAVVIDCWMNKLGEINFENRPSRFFAFVEDVRKIAAQRELYSDLKIPEALAETLLPIWSVGSLKSST